VGTVKQVELDDGGSRSYISVDGGMSDNIRTALYDAEYSVALASRASAAGDRYPALLLAAATRPRHARTDTARRFAIARSALARDCGAARVHQTPPSQPQRRPAVRHRRLAGQVSWPCYGGMAGLISRGSHRALPA
jgi:hypothetical protein